MTRRGYLSQSKSLGGFCSNHRRSCSGVSWRKSGVSSSTSSLSPAGPAGGAWGSSRSGPGRGGAGGAGGRGLDLLRLGLRQSRLGRQDVVVERRQRASLGGLVVQGLDRLDG